MRRARDQASFHDLPPTPYGAYDNLTGRDLPEAFVVLRRQLDARAMAQDRGKREFVQVPRLLEGFAIEGVAAGVRATIERRDHLGADIPGLLAEAAS